LVVIVVVVVFVLVGVGYDVADDVEGKDCKGQEVVRVETELALAPRTVDACNNKRLLYLNIRNCHYRAKIFNK
jgi:hypothetical protein